MDSQWLKTQFELNPDKTKAALAKALGLEPPAVSKMLRNGRQIKAHEYVAMRRFFGLPSDGARAAGSPGRSSYTLRPLEDTHDLQDEPKVAQAEWVLPADILSGRTSAPPDKIKIFQIRENTMEPDFRNGEYVLVDLSDTSPSPPGCFVITDGFGFMVRECAYMPQSDPPAIRISSVADKTNPETRPEDKVSITGRVIAKLQMV